jgi:hypothetical protein
MNKIMLALATVATLGLSTAAFAQNPTPSIKERVQPAQSKASVSHKMRVSHRVGSEKFVMAHHHNLHHQSLRPRHYSYDSGTKNFAKHTAAHKTVRTKASS